MKQQAFNPYLPGYEYIPDGEPYVFDGRVYVYGSHDHFNGKSFCVNDYVSWSAPVDDLSDWRYEGIIYKKGQDPLNKNQKQNLWAPDVARGTDGRYYLFYALNKTPVISVAVCDTPAGKYQFHGHVKYSDGHICGTKKGEVYNFDPGVFVDDDGRIYLYTGIAPRDWLYSLMKKRGRRLEGAYFIELEKDMLTMKAEPKLIVPGPLIAEAAGFEVHPFFEASSLRKINGRYYFIYSSILSHELCYAVSDKPDGGFVFGGTLVSNGDIGFNGNTEPLNYTGNTHGSLAQINGHWYVFYHRQTNCHQYSRQACAERLEILPDGSIPHVEMTSCGMNGGPLKGTGTYEARIACNLSAKDGACFSLFSGKKEKIIHPYFTQSGKDRENNSDQYIANLRDGSWAGFKYFNFTKNDNKITVKIRGNAKGTLNVSIKPNREPIAQLNVIQNSMEWNDISVPLKMPPGNYPLYFIYEGEGSIDFSSFTITSNS